MKNVTIALIVATSCLLAFTSNKPQRMDNPPHKTTVSPMEGAWELYSTEAKGKTTYHKKPKQIKVYQDNNFCMMHYDTTGKFYYACAGTYELDGNRYKETFIYHSMAAFTGASIWYDWSANGDTLTFAGFKKILSPDGKDVTQDWGGDYFIEKKVRVKK